MADQLNDALAVSPDEQRQQVMLATRTRLVDYVKETVQGVVSTLAVFLTSMLLVQLGLAREGQELSLELFSPYEFWKSFSGLVVEWSQWNEWLLLGLGLGLALLTVGVVLWQRHALPESESLTLWHKLTRAVHGRQTVGFLAMLATVFLGAYGYQQYLWRVALPVPKEQIGIAFTRQVGAPLAEEQLADFLRQMGHENLIAMRQLPVSLDARNTKQARALAARIGADAVVIYRQEIAPEGPSSDRTPGSAVTLPDGRQADASRYVAYIVFADPSLGIEIPVPSRGASGEVQSVSFRAKESFQAPRLEAGDVGRLMEAAAGILLYDQDRYLPSIAHLRNAVQAGGTGPSDALLHFYLANGLWLLDEDGAASAEFDRAIDILRKVERLSVQDRLVLARAYARRAEMHFWGGRELDEAEVLLKRAVALREPLDKDKAALADAARRREAHYTFGEIYLGLLSVAEYRQDGDAAALWASRARAEAEGLRSLSEDRNARIDGIWMAYRLGACEDAYSMAQSMLAQDPNDVQAHQLLWRLASYRANPYGINLDRTLHLEAVLALDPHALPELQAQLGLYALDAALRDPAYVERIQGMTDRILAIDPNNAAALEAYVSAVTLYTGWHLLPTDHGPLWPVGEARTAGRAAAGLYRDPAHIRTLLAEFDRARSYVIRWAEEVQPEAFSPLLYGARLSMQAETLLYNHLYIYMEEGARDRQLEADYQRLWARAVRDATRALDAPGRAANPLDGAQARALLVDLWTHRHYAIGGGDRAAAAKAATEALQHAEAAATLLAAVPDESKEGRDAHAKASLSLLFAYILAKNEAQLAGDTATAERYMAKVGEVQQRWVTLATQDLDRVKTEERYLLRARCASAELLSQAQGAADEGDMARAVSLAQQYTASYAQDPDGLLALGRYQYLSADLPGARQTVARLLQVVPGNPRGHAYQLIINVAEGRADATDPAHALIESLGKETVGLQLQEIAALAGDLARIAQAYHERRASVRQALAPLAGYLLALPSGERERRSGLVIQTVNELGNAALWAEDYVLADRLYRAGLALNADYALLRSNLGLLHLAEGDAEGARAEYSAAVQAAQGYRVDDDGELLADARLAASADAARNELDAALSALEAWLGQHPSQRSAAEPVAQLLQQALEALRN